jgi:predicted ATP-grasp superfamily ATP-dependent carboligase
MRVFVSEYICSGALADQPLPESLAAEGRAMWQAVIEDLIALGGISVTTTRDPRVAPLSMPGVDERIAATPDEERSIFRHCCDAAHAILVIAPELGDQLSRRIARARYWARGARVWNVPLNVSRLAADKFATWQCFARQGVPTVPTTLLKVESPSDSSPVVIKPRFGAGSQDTYLCHTRDEIRAAAARFAATPIEAQGIVQPHVAGRSLSCVIFVNSPIDSQLTIQTFTPPGEQRLSDDGRFQYLGGSIPAPNCDADFVHRLMMQALGAIRAQTRNGVEGPIGFDFIESQATGELLIVDVNARFTTSYLGYRRLTNANLLAPMVGRSDAGIEWTTSPVAFSVADFGTSG